MFNPFQDLPLRVDIVQWIWYIEWGMVKPNLNAVPFDLMSVTRVLVDMHLSSTCAHRYRHQHAHINTHTYIITQHALTHTIQARTRVG